MKTLKIIPLIFFILTIFNSCSNNSNDLDFFGNPKKLVIGYYSGANQEKSQAALEPFRAYLQKKLGIEVAFYYSTEFLAIDEALHAKKIQMAYLTPFAYVLATRKPGLIPIATLGIEGKPATYHSIIFTNAKTGVKTMDDLKARAKTLTFCFVDRTSTTGNLVPRAYLNSIGLDADTAFKQTSYAGTLAAAVMNVKSQKIDLGCSSMERGLNVLINQDSVKKEDVVILWTSPPVPFEAVTVRADINKDFIKKVQDAYMSAAKDDFPAFSKYVKLVWPHAENMSYVPVQDAMYNQLRKVAANTKFVQ